jgi:hypothetical protein
LVDVTDIIEPHKANLTPSALSSVHCYNATAKKRSFYGVPYLQASLLNHIWRPLIEKVGAKVEDIPKTWDARYDFFKGLRKKLCEQGMRNIFGVGFTVSTVGVDTNNQFNQFVIAYGGGNLVGQDGRLHLDDPAVRKAVIGTLTYQTNAYKQGFVPPSAINWNDSAASTFRACRPRSDGAPPRRSPAGFPARPAGPPPASQPRLYPSCTLVFMPWPTVGGWICAASPARNTRPTR